jgi:hypothetical protein
MKRPYALHAGILLAVWWLRITEAKSSPKDSRRIRLPGRPFTTDFDDDEDTRQKDERSPWTFGSGREFSLFGRKEDGDYETDDEDYNSDIPPWRTAASDSDRYRAQFSSSSGGTSSPSNNYYKTRSSKKQRASFLQPVSDWWTSNISPNIKSWPKIQCRVEPTTTLKIRKTFRPLGTIVRLGADFNTQLGVWQFKSSWEDAIIGGKLTLAGRELQLTKSWQLSVGAVEDLVTRLRFRAAVDLSTWKAYARVGFRTERLSPINVMEGFTLQKQVPLDGPEGHVKLQVKANFRLPEPEVEYSTETHRSLIGMGDIQVNIEELNLLLDY